MRKEMNMKEFIERFNNGDFESKNVKTKIESGWYDRLCRDESLTNKTKRMGNIIKQLKDRGTDTLETI